MFTDFIRNAVKMILMSVFTVGILLLNLYTGLEHFIGATAALELLGTDKKPIEANGLVGPFLSGLIPEATLAEILGFTLAVGVWLGLAFFFNAFFDLFRLSLVRRMSQDGAQKQHATAQMLWRLVEILIILVPLAGAIWWDLHLFSFRTVANAHGLDTHQTAAALLDWTGLRREMGDLYAVGLAGVGAWGYLGVTALCCVAVELSMRRTGEYFTRTFAPVDRFAESIMGRPESDDAGTSGAWVEDGESDDGLEYTGEESASASDDAPGPAPQTQTAPQAEVGAQFLDGSAQPAVVASPSRRQGVEIAAPAPAPPSKGPLFPAAPPLATPPTPRVPAPTSALDQEVIGGDGLRISVAQARREHQKYVIYMATGEIWAREYWEAVHGPPGRSPREG